jgi:putative membrane protein
MKPVTFLLLGLIVFSSCKDDENTTRSVTEPDKTFAMKASQASLDEIQMSQLVADRSENSAVEGFATHMIDEHNTAASDLQAIADNTDIVISHDIDGYHQGLIQKLSGLTGMAFDSVYMNIMVKDHMTAVDLFQSESTNGKDADVRGYADKYLPNLKEHLASAQALQETLMHPITSGRKAGD